jgi:hypothetical protein
MNCVYDQPGTKHARNVYYTARDLLVAACEPSSKHLHNYPERIVVDIYLNIK